MKSKGTIMKGKITDINKINVKMSRRFLSMTDIQTQYSMVETLIVFGTTKLRRTA